MKYHILMDLIVRGLTSSTGTRPVVSARKNHENAIRDVILRPAQSVQRVSRPERIQGAEGVIEVGEREEERGGLRRQSRRRAIQDQVDLDLNDLLNDL